MADRAQRRIHIKWVRSGIGFSYRQKEIIRSLGFRRLNEVVERQDTPQIRGLVAKIPHLVEIVSGVPKPTWVSVPEYTVGPAEAPPSQPTVTEDTEMQKAGQAPGGLEETSAPPAAEGTGPQAAEEAAPKPQAAEVTQAKKRAAAKDSKPAKVAGAKGKEGTTRKGGRPARPPKK